MWTTQLIQNVICVRVKLSDFFSIMLSFSKDLYCSKGAILVPYLSLSALKYVRIIREIRKELSVTASKKFIFLDIGKASHF